MINVDFWRDKKVFITGHTGFKGSWLSIWLKSLGAAVKGYSLPPETEPNLYSVSGIDNDFEGDYGDICDFSNVLDSLSSFNPDIVIHMAAQALVSQGYLKPVNTFKANVLGTVNVLEAVRNCSSVNAIINITTDKCYANDDRLVPYHEGDRLGAADPYSGSKACSELVTETYRKSYLNEANIGIATARAGNVIGGGDWSQDRLIPDILRAAENNSCIELRHPTATRPWQHVLEPLTGYLMLAEKLYEDPMKYSSAWNFGPDLRDAIPVSEVVDLMKSEWPSLRCKNSNDIRFSEAKILSLDTSKSRTHLEWYPVWDLTTTLFKISEWHKSWLQGANMQKVTLDQIGEFQADAKAKS